MQNGVAPPSPGGGDSLLAPPSVASLLDISLPGPPDESLPPGEPHTHISDSIIELAISSAHYGRSDEHTVSSVEDFVSFPCYVSVYTAITNKNWTFSTQAGKSKRFPIYEPIVEIISI